MGTVAKQGAFFKPPALTCKGPGEMTSTTVWLPSLKDLDSAHVRACVCTCVRACVRACVCVCVTTYLSPAVNSCLIMPVHMNTGSEV